MDKLLESQAQISTLKHQSELNKVFRQMAHDIKSPLLALKVIYRDLNDLSRDQREIIDTVIGRITTISDELLLRGRTFEKSNKFDDTLLSTSFLRELSFLVKEKNFASRATEESVVLKLNTADMGEFCFKTNSGELFRALSNLINNAIEASLNRGIVELTVRRKDEIFLIEITDKGTGIDEHGLSLIQNRKAFSTKENGNGLGLMHAISTIESSKGSILVKSKINKGTVVRIELPVLEVKEIKESPSPQNYL